MGKFYAVRKGKISNTIFNTWSECQKNITGFSGAEYKSFKTLEEANEYITNVTSNIIEEIDEDTIIAYVDGSYEDSQKLYGSGVVIIRNGAITEKISFAGEDEALLSMRNVAGEIKAAECAMEYTLNNSCKKLILHYDYEGIEKWCTKAWKASKEGTIRYSNIYEEFKKKGLIVQFTKVKAHSGNEYNDMADLLAKKSIENYRGIKL